MGNIYNIYSLNRDLARQNTTEAANNSQNKVDLAAVSRGSSALHNDAVKFSGTPLDAMSAVFKLIDVGGKAAEFTALDLCSMILPRTYQAYNRNREELGHPNYKAGVEEAIREFLTGPSMFLIPLGFLGVSRLIHGSAAQVELPALGRFSNILHDICQNPNELKLDNAIEAKKAFYHRIFDEAFKEHKKVIKNEKVVKPEYVDSVKDQIVDNIIKLQDKQAKLSRKQKKEIIHTINNFVADLNKNCGLSLDNPHFIKDSTDKFDNFSKNANKLVKNLIDYTDDVVEKVSTEAAKVSKNISNDTTKKIDIPAHLSEFCKKLTDKKINNRKLTTITGIISTGIFLYSIPKLYQRNKQYPGIEGLVPANNNSAQGIVNNQTDNGKKDKSVNNSNDKKQVSFKGGLNEKFLKAADFTGYNMSLPVLGLFTFGIVLGARLIQSRDKNERREVATRDFSAISTILFAVPMLKNIFATAIRKKSGFTLSYNDLKEGKTFLKNIWNHIRPEKGLKVIPGEHVKEWYSGVSKLKEGIVTFCEHLDKNGGDLKKIFGQLSNESKEGLNKIAKILEVQGNEAKNGLKIPDTNEKIIKMFKAAKENTEAKNILQTITKELDDEKNALVRFAENRRSIPEFVNYGITMGFLGWFLPWFNIQYTKRLYKNNPQAVSANNQNQNNPVEHRRIWLPNIQNNLFEKFEK